MPASAIDVAQECFVVGRLGELAGWAHSPSTASALWPGLSVTVEQDRGAEGVRWAVSGPLVGTAEIWLEPYGDGVLVHCYLRADRVGRPLRRAAALRMKRKWQRHLTGRLWELKDRTEAGRTPGTAGQVGGYGVKPTPSDAEA